MYFAASEFQKSTLYSKILECEHGEPASRMMLTVDIEKLKAFDFTKALLRDYRYKEILPLLLALHVHVV